MCSFLKAPDENPSLTFSSLRRLLAFLGSCLTPYHSNLCFCCPIFCSCLWPSGLPLLRMFVITWGPSK